jgi:hypothetical protein
MKILNTLRFAKGAGRSNPPVPALVPPPMGSDLRKSISISENVDILCEGRIYGLVDKFGKKVYGLDMLKGIYLNGTPVMTDRGEYNYRNVMMEINFGTENQRPLVNFKNVYITKPFGFKLLGPITSNAQPDELRADPNGGGLRDFRSWAINSQGWPSSNQDPYIFIHKIKNRDVKKIKISLMIEALMDTVDQGSGSGKAGAMGMNKSTTVNLRIKWGLDQSLFYYSKDLPFSGLVQSPYAYMIGNGTASFSTASSSIMSGGDETSGQSTNTASTAATTVSNGLGVANQMGRSPSNAGLAAIINNTNAGFPYWTGPQDGGDPVVEDGQS